MTGCTVHTPEQPGKGVGKVQERWLDRTRWGMGQTGEQFEGMKVRILMAITHARLYHPCFTAQTYPFFCSIAKVAGVCLRRPIGDQRAYQEIRQMIFLTSHWPSDCRCSPLLHTERAPSAWLRGQSDGRCPHLPPTREDALILSFQESQYQLGFLFLLLLF